jgi:hypothetical protein
MYGMCRLCVFVWNLVVDDSGISVRTVVGYGRCLTAVDCQVARDWWCHLSNAVDRVFFGP